MPATRLVLVRHGQAMDVAGRCIGHTDVPLSTEGATAVRHLLMNERGTRDLLQGCQPEVISSDLRRAAGSASILAAALGCAVAHDARLREMSFGEWDGRLWTEIERDDGERFRHWMERWVQAATPGGESAGDLLRRAGDWIEEILRRPAVDRCIVAVSHAGWIRAAVTHLFGSDPARLFDIPADHAHATIVDVGASGPSLMAFNVDRLP